MPSPTWREAAFSASSNSVRFANGEDQCPSQSLGLPEFRLISDGPEDHSDKLGGHAFVRLGDKNMWNEKGGYVRGRERQSIRGSRFKGDFVKYAQRLVCDCEWKHKLNRASNQVLPSFGLLVPRPARIGFDCRTTARAAKRKREWSHKIATAQTQNCCRACRF